MICGVEMELDVKGRGCLDLNVRRRSLILSSWILVRLWHEVEILVGKLGPLVGSLV